MRFPNGARPRCEDWYSHHQQSEQMVRPSAGEAPAGGDKLGWRHGPSGPDARRGLRAARQHVAKKQIVVLIASSCIYST